MTSPAADRGAPKSLCARLKAFLCMPEEVCLREAGLTHLCVWVCGEPDNIVQGEFVLWTIQMSVPRHSHSRDPPLNQELKVETN